jgi:alpha-L-fucosidase
LVPQNERHCNLLLNAPPTREGKLAPNVLARLKEIGEAWSHNGPAPKLGPTVVITSPNLATGNPTHASSSPDTVGPDQANNGNFRSSWCLEEGQTQGWLEVELPRGTSFNMLVLVEPVGRWDDYQCSRIRSHKFQRYEDGEWIDMAGGGAPKRVQTYRIPRTSATRVRLLIEASRDMPHVTEIGVHNEAF